MNLLVLVLLAGSPGTATKARLLEYAAGWKLASSSETKCESLGPLLVQAEMIRLKADKPIPDEWGRALRFDCAKKQVCSDGKDKKPGTKDDACEALETVTQLMHDDRLKMQRDLVMLTEGFAPKYRCEDLKSELASMRVGDSWKRLLRVDCTWRVVCSDGPDGAQGNADDVCHPMR